MGSVCLYDLLFKCHSLTELDVFLAMTPLGLEAREEIMNMAYRLSALGDFQPSGNLHLVLVPELTDECTSELECDGYENDCFDSLFNRVVFTLKVLDVGSGKSTFMSVDGFSIETLLGMRVLNDSVVMFGMQRFIVSVLRVLYSLCEGSTLCRNFDVARMDDSTGHLVWGTCSWSEMNAGMKGHSSRSEYITQAFGHITRSLQKACIAPLF